MPALRPEGMDVVITIFTAICVLGGDQKAAESAQEQVRGGRRDERGGGSMVEEENATWGLPPCPCLAACCFLCG